MKKRVFALIGTLIIMASMFAMTCSAASLIHFYNSSKKLNWSESGAYCELDTNKKGKVTKNAKVNVYLCSTMTGSNYAVDILMKDENGKVIWAEDRSIVAKALQTKRVYNLGKDHKAYQLFFRPTQTDMSWCAYVSVTAKSNCTVY